MLLALIMLLSTADAHPTRHPTQRPVPHVTVVTHPSFHWVNSHYNKWGRWIPGHWVAIVQRDEIVCRRDREGRTYCEAI
jgi:hypothetical protein